MRLFKAWVNSPIFAVPGLPLVLWEPLIAFAEVVNAPTAVGEVDQSASDEDADAEFRTGPIEELAQQIAEHRYGKNAGPGYPAGQ
jgi:hypothetical protein